MTETETVQVCDMLIDQVGVKPEDVMKSLALWKMNLLTIDYPKAQEAVKVLMMERVTNKTAGGWLATIIKHCGGSTQIVNQQKVADENPGCARCQFSGYIEVPHCKDWEHNRWKGMYTMVVACECPAGQLKACQISNIRYYESRFPQWQEEYPRRRIEMQLREADTKPEPSTKAEKQQHQARMIRLRSELDFLDGEVPEFEVSR